MKRSSHGYLTPPRSPDFLVNQPTVASPLNHSPAAAPILDPFDPLEGYAHQPPSSPGQPTQIESSRPSSARTRRNDKPSMSSSSRGAPPARPSTRSRASGNGRRHSDAWEEEEEELVGARMTAKLQPPKDPDLFDTEDAWRQHHELEKTSGWHHVPLILVALPPLGAIIHGRAENWSDAIILILICFYLYQLIKVPWEIYYASQARYVLPQARAAPDDATFVEDPLVSAQRDASAAALRRNELFSLLSTMLVPAIGAGLLHYARGLLSDPDRYINRFLISLFAIATSVKPFLHFTRLVKRNSLYHQEAVHYPSSEVHRLRRRVERLETDLVQLSRAFATKSDVRALRDGVDVPLTALSKAVRRFNRKEEYLRLTSEERFALLVARLDEATEVQLQQQQALEDLEREANDVDVVKLVGKVLNHVLATRRSVAWTIGEGLAGGRAKGAKNGPEQVGWYERGIMYYLLWPVNVPRTAIGWAVGRAHKVVRGIEGSGKDPSVEEQKARVRSAGGNASSGGVKA
ncbi:hypothetical protein JCM21900_004201 [Sporobolomyces salmonicolor]